MTNAVDGWIQRAKRLPMLDQDETLKLARRIQKAKVGSATHTKLVNKLCEANLRLVVKFTLAYVRGQHLKLYSDFTLDLLQEGYFGLRRAAVKFDPERGYTFATYANAWVRQSIGKYHVDKMSLIRVPESTAREINVFNKRGTSSRRTMSTNWLKHAADCAKQAYRLISYDIPTAEGTLLSETFSVDNMIHDPEETTDYSKCFEIMDEIGVDPETQKLIVSYLDTGSMAKALERNGLPYKETLRKRIRDNCRLIQQHCVQ